MELFFAAAAVATSIGLFLSVRALEQQADERERRKVRILSRYRRD